MPELPEVETVRRTLEPYLTGKCIQSFDLLWPRSLSGTSLDGFRDAIAARTIVRVGRRGKLLVIELDSGDWITVHLRMTGELLYHPAGAPPRAIEREPYLRASFGLTDGADLLFYDTRKFGRITYFPSDTTENLESELGLEPLASTFTTSRLTDLFRRRRRMKSLLLDQRVIAGLGNIYVDEALFAACINPLRRADTLSVEEVERLRSAIVEVLSAAVASRGTTLRDYRTGLGEPGTNQQRLRVYGKSAGSPCPRCGTPLIRTVVDQRTTMYCPVCQPPFTSTSSQ